jgi:hypothetical protein
MIEQWPRWCRALPIGLVLLWEAVGQRRSARTLNEKRIAQCEKARSAAHDPDFQILWESKARQLRDKRTKGKK